MENLQECGEGKVNETSMRKIEDLMNQVADDAGNAMN